MGRKIFHYVVAALGGVLGGYIILVGLMIARGIEAEPFPPTVEVIIFVLSWLLPFLLIRWWLVRDNKGPKKVFSGLFTVVLVLVLLGGVGYLITSPYRLVAPTKIVGGAPGDYSDRQTVWMAKKILIGRPIQKGDVVVFNQPTDGQPEVTGGYIGEVVGMPNDVVNTTIYDFNDNIVSSEIPAGYYLIEKNKTGVYRILPQNLVTDVVVWP
jgi:hypothetical protein